MWAFLLAVAQLFLIILQTAFTSNKEEKDRREELHKDWAEVIKSGDAARVNAMLLRIKLRS